VIAVLAGAPASDPDRFAAHGLTAEGLAVQIGLGAAAL